MLPPTLEPKEPTLKEPGVYVRSHVPDHELDVLWDRERRRHDEHDRSHLGYFIAGAVAGSVLTLAACFFLSSNASFVNMNKPTQIEEEVLSSKDLPAIVVPTTPAATAPPVTVEKNHSSGLTIPFITPKNNVQQPQKAATLPNMKAQSYAVQSGDSLGSIAIKFYHSSSPEFVNKIQRANKLSSPDDLSLGQKLTIPPKTY